VYLVVVDNSLNRISWEDLLEPVLR